MKKLLFAALVATVAVGGALSSQATTYHGQSRSYNCTQSTTLCATIGEDLWLNSANVGDGNPDIAAEDVPTFFDQEKFD